MKQVFIDTDNVVKAHEMCAELESTESLTGPSLAMITGATGRGKSEFSRHYATNSTAIYIPPMNIRTPTMLLREITFELCSTRPGRSDKCLEIIGEEMSKDRRLIIVDEADLLAISILEMLRNVNERYACPILLVGEDGLKGKVASRRRIANRIRRRVEFGPVTQPDIVLYFRKAVEAAIPPEGGAVIQKYSGGSWMRVLKVAVAIERAMRASGLKEVSVELTKRIIDDNS
jgi:DNA transposition AAA+ family ATPase